MPIDKVARFQGNGTVLLNYYCNSLLVGLPASSTQKLQKGQNAAARLVLLPRQSRPTLDLLTELAANQRSRIVSRCA